VATCLNGSRWFLLYKCYHRRRLLCIHICGRNKVTTLTKSWMNDIIVDNGFSYNTVCCLMLHVRCRVCSVSMGTDVDRPKQSALLRQVCMRFLLEKNDNFCRCIWLQHSNGEFVSLYCEHERILKSYTIFYTFSHGTELTQWDHPEMAEILNSLSEFNTVKLWALC